MTVRLFTAPAGAGKTQACIDRVCSASHERPLAPVWICLPNSAQVMAFRRRLADAGGAMGVEVGTFFDLYRETLRAAGQVTAELAEPLQHRLLRAVIDHAAAAGDLQYYAALRDRPGFVRALHGLIEELKRAQILPAHLQAVVRGQGRRLEELAALYTAYQRWLAEEQWMDLEGLGWLAAEALERNPGLFSHWALAVVDGFDEYNPTQLRYLRALAGQVQELWITLASGPRPGRLAQRRFEQALACLQQALPARAEPLLGSRTGAAPALAHLEAALFEPAPVAEGGEAVAWLEAPNRSLEVRAALRWVKERLVRDGMGPASVAVLARDLAAYAALLLETAEEFGIPLALAEGPPLASNPAVARLLELLSLVRRGQGGAAIGDGRFGPRQVLEVLRSPYFDWRAVEVAGVPLGLTAEDADLLERAASAGLVVGGLEQWREALRLAPRAGLEEGEDRGELEGAGAAAARRATWDELRGRFERFVQRVTPPAEDTVAAYTAFVEDLIGDEPGDAHRSRVAGCSSLQVLQGVRAGPPALAARDVEALRQLKEALRGLVLAAEVLGAGEKVPYERFLDELEAVISARRYRWVDPRAGQVVWAASVHEARGLSFGAVALLGLSEGEFPRAASGDPLLRDEDREWLAAQGLPVAVPPPGGEFTLFYEAVTRARERLLLARTYLGDDGQPWAASPFWDDTLRLFAGEDEAARKRLVSRTRSADPLPLERAASWTELVTALSQQVRAGGGGTEGVAAALAGEPEAAQLWGGVERGAEMLATRLRWAPSGPFEGDCAPLGQALAGRHAPDHPWSASRLEAYLECPFAFFLAYALELQPRQPVATGFDAAQLGGMYHEILEKVYAQAPGGNLEGLLAALPHVAGEVLERAPATYGFRPSQLWEQEKARIREHVENTLRALVEVSEGWRPVALELRFGRQGDAQPAARIAVEGKGAFRLRGIIDRVDRNAAGELRLIDYKSGSEAITARDLLEGRRIQLALYAWAAQQALGRAVHDGFYWHVRAARRSSLRLEGVDGGVPRAMAHAAARAWEAIEGVGAGRFPPEPGERGCPAYCVASGFCWRRR